MEVGEKVEEGLVAEGGERVEGDWGEEEEELEGVGWVGQVVVGWVVVVMEMEEVDWVAKVVVGWAEEVKERVEVGLEEKVAVG